MSRAGYVLVDGEAGEVLKAGEGLGFAKRPFELKQHSTVSGFCHERRKLCVCLVPLLLLLAPLFLVSLFLHLVHPSPSVLGSAAARAHIVLHQAGDVREGEQARPGGGAGIQLETAAAVLNAYVSGATLCLHR